MQEWDIPKLFPTPPISDIILGNGDDAAVTQVPPGYQLVTTCDAVLEGVHFPVGAPWDKVGYRAMVAAISDVAAMAATPRWVVLALSLPQPDEATCQALAAGIQAAAHTYQVQIIGGNTTAGPFNLSITVMGLVQNNRFLTRSGAQPGDGIFVTGTLGDAALGLQCVLGQHASEYAINRFWAPTARIDMKDWLHAVHASSCIDISDGLIGDLKHILQASQVGAQLDSHALPLSPALQALEPKRAVHLALGGGEDYELCFTAPIDTVAAIQAKAPVPVTQVGIVTSDLYYKVDDKPIEDIWSYQHWTSQKP